MKITEDTKIEQGMIMGFAKVEAYRSDFAICTVKDWKKMTEKEAEKATIEALNESGLVEHGYYS